MYRSLSLAIAIVVNSIVLASEPPKAASVPSGSVSKEARQIAALLQSRCAGCHSGRQAEGGYRLETISSISQAGESGRMPIDREQPDRGELLVRLRHPDMEKRMPPDGQGLGVEDIQNIASWLRSSEFSLLPPEQSLIDLALADLVQGDPPSKYPESFPVSAIALRHDGKAVYVAGRHEVLQWSVDGTKLRQRIPGFGRRITSMSIDESDSLLAVSSGVPGQAGVVQLLQLGSREPPKLIDRFSDVPQTIRFSPKQDWLAIGALDGSLSVRSASTLDKLFSATPHADAILAMNWSVDGKILMTASRDRTARTFDVEGKKLITAYDRHDRSVGGVAFLNENPLSVDETGKLRMWPKETGEWTAGDGDGFDRRLQNITVHDNIIYSPSHDRVRRFELKWREVDDGKDDKGNPKKKNKAFFDELPSLLAAPNELLLCMDISHRGNVVAGTQSGKVFAWVLHAEDRKILESSLEWIQKKLQPTVEGSPDTILATSSWAAFGLDGTSESN